MFLHFLLSTAFLAMTYAEHGTCPIDIQMQSCQCKEISKVLYVHCENVEVHKVKKDLANVTCVDQSVDLSVNKTNLVNLSYDLLAGLKFTHLEILHCNLSSVDPEVFINVTDVLEWLSLSYNNLTRVPSEALEILTNLKYLYLDYNQLKILHGNSFKGLRSLRTLSLRGNHMRVIDHQAFQGIWKKFTKLDLGWNELTSVPTASLSGTDSLETLKLQRNLIVSLQQEDFRDLNSLTHLIIADNNIRQVPTRAFWRLRKLLVLDLSGNEIDCIHPFAFHGIEDTLKHLELGSNRLMEVPAESLMNTTRLEVLSLHGNNVTVIRKDDFLPFGSRIKKIYLQNNLINYVDSMAFICLKSLESLFLGSNQLKTAPFETYAPFFDRLRDLDVHGNPFHCDCSISSLRNLIKGNSSTVILSLNSTRCASPEEFAGMAIADITDDRMICPNETSKLLQSCVPIGTASNSLRFSGNAFTIVLQISFIYVAIALGSCRLY